MELQVDWLVLILRGVIGESPLPDAPAHLAGVLVAGQYASPRLHVHVRTGVVY
jgi:hypothetical protein